LAPSTTAGEVATGQEKSAARRSRPGYCTAQGTTRKKASACQGACTAPFLSGQLPDRDVGITLSSVNLANAARAMGPRRVMHQSILKSLCCFIQSKGQAFCGLAWKLLQFKLNDYR